jgi:hypothetical protein
MSADSTAILELIAAAPARVTTAHFESEGEGFDLTLRLFSRADLERIRKACMRRVFDRDARQVVDNVDERKLREYLATHAIVDWDGLTGHKLAVFARRNVALNGNAEALRTALPFDQKVAIFLLEQAVCIRDSGTVGFGDWLWEQVTGAAETFAQVDAEKKTS